jgi:hypothetical protein
MTAESVLPSNSIRERLDDWTNPIVIKELRQAVQSRFVVSALLLLLSIQLIAIGIYLLASGSWLLDFDAGRQVFMILYGILLGVSIAFVPLYTAIRLIAERSDTNVDLLFITTIKPHSIIGGKLFAALILNVLIFSSCMPFMVFTYFLRGIDLPSIFVALALGFLIVIACTQAAIFIACIPVNRVFKFVFGLIMLWIFLMVYVATLSGASGLILTGVGSRFDSAEFWEGVLGFLGFFGLLVGLFFVLSVALITPMAANRALPVRSFVTIAWALLGVAVFSGSFIEKNHNPVMIWQIVFNSIFATALFVAVSERDQLGRRVLRSIPKSPLKRMVAFVFFSGAASGLVFACVGIILTLALAWLWSKLFSAYINHDDLVDSVKWVGGMSLYFYCYALSAALLRRHLLSRVGTELTWLIGVILMLMGIVIPFLAGYMIFFKDAWWSEDYGKWLVGNPFAWGSKSHRVFYFEVGAFWAVMVTALNIYWFLGRVRSFKPLNSRDAVDHERSSRPVLN